MHFSWLMDCDPRWAILQVFDALASLPFLKDLHLRCWSFLDKSLQIRRLPHLEKLTVTRESWRDNDRRAIVPIARLINWNQPTLTTLIIAEDSYYNDQKAPNLNDFFLETSKSSAFLNITHLRLKGLFVKLDATMLPHLRSLISLTTEFIFTPQDQVSGNHDAGFSSGNVWSVLRFKKLHLQEIVTDKGYVSYFSSISPWFICVRRPHTPPLPLLLNKEMII
jgi:hypothetical protein